MMEKRLKDAAYVVCTEVFLAQQRAIDSLDAAERRHRDMLTKVKKYEKETATRKFYWWVFGTLLLGLVLGEAWGFMLDPV